MDINKPSEQDGEEVIDLTSMVEAFEKNIIREACEKYGSNKKGGESNRNFPDPVRQKKE